MHRVLLITSAWAIPFVIAGCATLNPPPPVDLLPTTPKEITPRPQTKLSNGSLFHAASYRPAFEDQRARFIGDLVTVKIEEEVRANQNSTSNVKRDSKLKAGVTAFPFAQASTLGKLNLETSNANSFKGEGGTTNSNNFKGHITATVVEVLPNGHLVIAGEKQIGVNENVDVLRFSGTIDPRSMQPGSVVSSLQVANARLQSRGRGAASEAQAIGWLHRAFNSVSPF